MILKLVLISQLSFAAVGVDQSELVSDLEKTKETLAQEEARSRRVMSTLFDITKKMKSIVSEKAKQERESYSLEASNSELAAKILELEQKTKTQKSQLRERLAALYKLGGQGLARIVFSASDSAQLERNLRILGLIAKRDMDLIKDYTSSLKDIERKRSRLVQRIAHLKKLEGQIKRQEALLLEEHNSKQKILDAIRNNKRFAMEKIVEIREKTAKSDIAEQGLLDLLLRPSFFEKRGELEKPIAGKVSQRFGVWRDPRYQVALSHKGLFFEALQETAVKSVFDGVVAFAGYLDGYGKTVIVDHADHYYTVYAHNKSLAVELGKEVKAGELLAKSGFSILHQKPGLYFEVRHFSEPTNPNQWLKGISK